MDWYLYQWGDAVEVLEPAGLRAMVADYQRADFKARPKTNSDQPQRILCFSTAALARGMSEDPTTGIVKELMGQLPIKDAHNDPLSRGMEQSGRHFEDIAKTVRLALIPFQDTAVLQDKFSAFLKKLVRPFRKSGPYRPRCRLSVPW